MLTRAFEEAVTYAAIVHADQPRKRVDDASGGAPVPYLAHLLAVASLVLEDGGTEEEGIAALLHDAVEDRGGQPRLADIRTRFGPRVADIVLGCSDATPSDGEAKPDWWARKAAYVAHLDRLDDSLATSIFRVSMADKLHNLRATVRDARSADPSDMFWGIFKTGALGQYWYYGALLRVYRRRDQDGVLLPDLESAYRELATVIPEGDRLEAEHRLAAGADAASSSTQQAARAIRS